MEPNGMDNSLKRRPDLAAPQPEHLPSYQDIGWRH